ncbi:PTS mannose/fructose/sorbose transporter subunit IIC [Aerococcus urinae]|uniref:PTS mannose/fructose/sorbose transporter subunit IIC n=1 Tax=Aerococcus urinae TaxID=1376 RepID=A0A109RET8_9LACT|nr:PTS mannose/fructose/sorbose transporter subunit IIC [Aerococcus urinae]AMB96443.1 PTS mannose/fructose/sorbose transporter subunit IIC [Aerococcus urinae]MCY3032184.1 PTS mannose/fructose/sorbose transporter subunit IIC [Aerococcus urinae]MCY3037690.1 PTS mannose/fructose/sorbose transporter subunit IIC [Aerococcus urinae]MCY3044230.1 PTS mannose/fructose/sorbose transporter subunit IIC [Aerococcus urinae]MCY3045645.1 PTS mannose/fructose/sorbose transporter subunit IIC [Aerococcus urinae]
MTSIQMILLIILSGIVGMGAIVDESQIHRPLVVCTLVGLILGDLKTGLLLGGSLEMMSLGWMNVGLAMAPDTAIASMISSILVIQTGNGIGEGIAIAVPLAAAGQALTIFVRTITTFFSHQADKYALDGNTRGIDAMFYIGLFLQALRVLLPTALILLIDIEAVNQLLTSIPTFITEGLTIGGGMVMVVGYAMIINMMDVPYLKPFFYIGFILAAFSEINLVGYGILGACLAAVFVYLKYNPSSNHQLITESNDNNYIPGDLDDDLDDDLDID